MKWSEAITAKALRHWETNGSTIKVMVRSFSMMSGKPYCTKPCRMSPRMADFGMDAR
jgi:hypothetical protein